LQWIEGGLWALSGLLLLLAYRPPKRHTELDHLTVWQKLRRIDVQGGGLLAIGLVLLITGLNLGGVTYPWASAPIICLLILGPLFFGACGLYEWKGTSTGIVPHELFDKGKTAVRTLVICLSLIHIEGILIFAFLLMYPIL
jgi:hypothetical protein